MFEPGPFHPRRPGLVAPVRTDAAGLSGPTPGQARGPRWRQTSQGFHVPTSVDAEHPGQRTVEAAALLQPGEGVTGWAGLAWQGGRWFDGTRAGDVRLPVPLAVTRHVLPHAGVVTSQEYLRPGEVSLLDGLPVTHAARSVCFEMRYAPDLTAAVAALDMAAYSDLVSVSEAWAYNDTLWTWTGVPLSRKAIALAEENSWSPQETVMRLVWKGWAACPLLCNVPVFDQGGRHLATPDLLDPQAGVVGEYDSGLHLLGAQRARDVRRESVLRAVGLEYVTMLSADHADHYASFCTRLEGTYARARFAAERDREWTVALPSWWTDTTTVAARRALDPLLRDRLLRYRRAA